jgi:hypothetical protein
MGRRNRNRECFIMNVRPAPEIPDWLVPGTKVLVHRTGVGIERSGRIHITAVEKVATQSFTVVGNRGRFRITTLSRHEPGTWGASERVLPVNSDEAQKLIREARGVQVTSRARSACEEWIRLGGRERLVAAIEALQAVKDSI